jgi:hypothetical protein
MKYNYDVYIKGRAHNNIASCAIIIIEDGVEIFSGGMRFVDNIQTQSEVIPLLPYKSQYQMELYALAWALTKCKEDSYVNIYTNNIVFKTWIERMEVGIGYNDLFTYCKKFMNGKKVEVQHVKKGSDSFTERCNDIAVHYEQLT